MRAALRFIDDFLPVHNLESLEALVAHLNSLLRSTQKIFPSTVSA